MAPSTPRPIGSSPTGRKPVDQYGQPMTPRPGEKDVFRSPGRGQEGFGHVPGMSHDPSFPQVPRSQAQGMWPGKDGGDPYSPAGGAPHQRGHPMPPPLDRQLSAPTQSVAASSSQDPFLFSGNEHPEATAISESFSMMSSTPGAPAHGPRPPMHRVPSMPGDMHMQRPPRHFRYPGMRLPVVPGDGFGIPPGAQRPRLDAPGLRPPPEASAVSFHFFYHPCLTYIHV